MRRLFASSVIYAAVLLSCAASHGQGTLEITFDGPSLQPPGSIFGVQSYSESGMSFYPYSPGTDQFGRAWVDLPTSWPSDGTPFIITGQGDSFGFNFSNGSLFGIQSVDLASFSTGFPTYAVNFVGYHADGSTITTSFSGSGIDFQTYNFGPDWSSGLTKVEIPNYGWSLDNLVVAIPEPSSGALFVLGGLTLSLWQGRRAKT